MQVKSITFFNNGENSCFDAYKNENRSALMRSEELVLPSGKVPKERIG